VTNEIMQEEDILPYQRVLGDTLYASEAAAIEGARSVALQAIASGSRAALETQ
jgi:hypothetical protein